MQEGSNSYVSNQHEAFETGDFRASGSIDEGVRLLSKLQDKVLSFRFDLRLSRKMVSTSLKKSETERIIVKLSGWQYGT